MKIHSSSGAIGYSSINRDKEGSNAFFEQNSKQKHPEKDNNAEQEVAIEPEMVASSESIDLAVEAFQSDSQTQARGLNASVEGTGPGLKIVLKDGTGSVLRRFSGEEFLRMREATSKDGRIRGKILDQKL
jgi:uncharacterized protein YlxW (UPF0749 family)